MILATLFGVHSGGEEKRDTLDSALVSRSAVRPVRACGAKLCVGTATYYPYGATFYSSSAASGIVSDPAGAVSVAQDLHLNLVRAVNWLDVDGDPASATQAASWGSLDRFVAESESSGLRVDLDFSDYAILLMHNCVDPYTDLTGWDRFLGYAANRLDPFTGRAYGDDPGVAMVEFAGEPEEAGYPSAFGWHDGKYYTYSGGGGDRLGSRSDPAPQPDWGTGPTGPGSCTTPLYYTSEQLTAFYAHVETVWKQHSATLTMAGGLTKLDEPDNGGIDYQAIFANPDNDLCDFKSYGGMQAWLATGVRFCTSVLHKPSIDDEWGYQQDLGDSRRAAAFSAQFSAIARAGVAGNILWNAGDQVLGQSYDVGPGPADPLTFAVVVAHAPRQG